MDIQEAVHLSQSIGLNGSTDITLSSVMTDFYILIARGNRTSLRPITRNMPPGTWTYWRSNQIDKVEYQKVVVHDMHTAALARVFADGQEVRKLTVGELAQARNEIDLPGMPSIKGYIQDRAWNDEVADILTHLHGAHWRARTLQVDGLVDAICACGTLAQSLQRQTV